MDLRHHNLQQLYTSSQQQPQDSNNFRDLFTIEGRISPATGFDNSTNLQDHSQHPPYIPPFHVAGFAPGPAVQTDGTEGGADIQWNYGLEKKRKRPKEQDFLENNSPISSIDFLQPQPVSTGLGLSLDNARMSSSDGSALHSLIGDTLDRELQIQDAETDRFLKVQAEQLRRTILTKVQTSQLQTLSLMEKTVLQKIHEKEAEVQSINRKNKELEERVEQLATESCAWAQRARYNENMIEALRRNLQQVYTGQPRDSKEGCGDSEVDDTASCWNKDGSGTGSRIRMSCKYCEVGEACVLLLPCKHLCLCKDCDSKIDFCPLCRSSKFRGLEVHM